MSEEKKLDYQIKRWSDNRERALSHKWYATGRIDLLIVSISGAGIYIGFELMKFALSTDKISYPLDIIKWSMSLFTLAIIVNFISQFFGYRSNDLESKYDNSELKDLTGEKEKDQETQNILDCKIKISNSVVNACNYLSTGLMLSGIVLLVLFNIKAY